MKDQNNANAIASLRGSYAILDTKVPLPEGSLGEAWAVSHAAHAPGSLFAITGKPADCFRIDMAPKLQALGGSGVLCPLDWGIVDWTDNQQRIALIFPKPSGVTLQSIITGARRRVPDVDLIIQILPQIVGTLRTLEEKGIFHGSIRPATITIDTQGLVMLGECLSSPPSFTQPVWTQTIDRAFADPLGRGVGTMADEIYALGMTVLQLAIGDGFQSVPDADQIRARIEKGTFGALVGRQILTNGLGDLLHGMLDDDPALRWDLDTIEQWAMGRRPVTTNSRAVMKPAKPLVVQGVEYWDPRSVAEAISRNVSEAMRLISDEELIKWTRRTLQDLPMSKRIADAINMPNVKGKPGAFEAILAARLAIALHPGGPIRYMGVSVMPLAIGTLLQKAFVSGETAQVLAEIISSQLPKYWYNSQIEFSGDHVTPMKIFEQARVTMDRIQPGGGLERCLYDLAQSSPLLAPEVKSHIIIDKTGFLEALETLSESSDHPALPIGRHTTAFFIARDSQMARLFNRFAVAPSDLEKGLGCLQILSYFQSKSALPRLTGIARWLEAIVLPCVDRFHNRQTRDLVRAELRKAASEGNLAQMYAIADNPVMEARDHEEFQHAWVEYQQIDHQIQSLKNRLKPGARLHITLGEEAAATVSGILASIIVAGLFITRLVAHL